MRSFAKMVSSKLRQNYRADRSDARARELGVEGRRKAGDLPGLIHFRMVRLATTGTASAWRRYVLDHATSQPFHEHGGSMQFPSLQGVAYSEEKRAGFRMTE